MTNIRAPKISVCIPTYNRADLLKQSVASVLNQAFYDYELIISDNASQDGTAEVIKSFNDSRIIYISKEKNIGLVNNWNSCLAAAKGKYITIFNDDDLMMPDNLAMKVQVLEGNRNAGLVHANFHIIDEKGEIMKEGAHPNGYHDFEEAGLLFLKKNLLGNNQVVPPSPLIRKECFLRLGGFSEKILFTTDFEYWMRIAIHYGVMYLGKPLMKYRMYHNAGWTSSKYYTVIDGDTFVNLVGLEDEYTTRKIILQLTKNILSEWGDMNVLVRKRMIASVNRLIEKQYLRYGKKSEAINSIFQVCRKFPDLLFDISMTRLIIKALFGHRATELLKYLLMTHRENKRMMS